MHEKFSLEIQVEIYFHEGGIKLVWQLSGRPAEDLNLDLDASSFKSEADRYLFEQRLHEQFKIHLPTVINDDIQGFWMELASSIGIELGANAWKGVEPGYAKREVVAGQVERRKELMRSILRTRAPGRPESHSSARLRREIRAAIKQILKDDGSPKIEAVAAHMGMSKAALARQIGRKELSFKAIRREVLDKEKKRT
jgi:hypothetical protein